MFSISEKRQPSAGNFSDYLQNYSFYAIMLTILFLILKNFPPQAVRFAIR